MGRHSPQRCGRWMRSSSTCWSTSPRSTELRLFCLCFHAVFCIVHVSAQPSSKARKSARRVNMVLIAIIVACAIAFTAILVAIATFLFYWWYSKRRPVQKPADVEFGRKTREETMLSYADANGSSLSASSNEPNVPGTNPGQFYGISTFSNSQTGNELDSEVIQSNPPSQAKLHSTDSRPKGRWQPFSRMFSDFRVGNESSGVSSSTYQDTSSRASIALNAVDVKRATRNFESKIGQGGFGSVYFGKLPGNQMEVAVKVQAKDSRQGAREFATEVEILSRCKHPNLVSLVGYSEDEGGYMLVYEFLSGGTLQARLRGSRSNPPLDWNTRLKLAVQAAKGLEYLHNQCVPSIIHRDVKSDNVLLTKLDDAKVTDFGLCKFVEDNLSHVSKCSVKGTMGYLDPEYFESQKFVKSDVYSFGIVLLELVSGREPLDKDRHRVHWKITDWAKNLLTDGDIRKVADKALYGKYDSESMWTVAELAMRCVEPRSVHRPTISQVVLELEKAVKEASKGTKP